MRQESRRKILKGLAVTIPATWVTPVVESVISPAHARSSPDCECEDFEDESFLYVREGPSDVVVRTYKGSGCDENNFIDSITVVEATESTAAEEWADVHGQCGTFMDRVDIPSQCGFELWTGDNFDG